MDGFPVWAARSITLASATCTLFLCPDVPACQGLSKALSGPLSKASRVPLRAEKRHYWRRQDGGWRRRICGWIMVDARCSWPWGPRVPEPFEGVPCRQPPREQVCAWRGKKEPWEVLDRQPLTAVWVCGVETAGRMGADGGSGSADLGQLIGSVWYVIHAAILY
ncbi:hypothetical protein F5884DRAFT_464400 [Xylogone sp. PMI_703]|nr:hypothetical protein F5884DRAFT_464400 [Xylogone sp. PMI_703]